MVYVYPNPLQIMNERKVKAIWKSQTQDTTNTKAPTVFMQKNTHKHIHTHTHTHTHTLARSRAHSYSDNRDVIWETTTY